MRLFDVGETIEPGWRLQTKRSGESQKMFLPLGSPGSSRYLELPAGRSLWRWGEQRVKEAELHRGPRGAWCLVRQQEADGHALVRVLIASTPEIRVHYEFNTEAAIIMGGVFGTDPPMPMYLIDMAPGGSFRWQRGHDGVVHTWDGQRLRVERGLELPK